MAVATSVRNTEERRRQQNVTAPHATRQQTSGGREGTSCPCVMSFPVLTGTGCPSRMESTFLRFRSSLSFRYPVSAHTAYRMGAA